MRAEDGTAAAGARGLAFGDVALRRVLVAVAMTVEVAAGFVLASGAAAAPGVPVPAAANGGAPGWLRGPLETFGMHLTPDQVGALFLLMCAGYLVVLVCADAASVRWSLAAIASLHVIFLLAPPLFSADVMGYVAFGRMGVLHGLNPYTHGVNDIPTDAAYPYAWHGSIVIPYGPLFTLLAYAFVPLGVAGALWAFKLTAAAASAGLLVLVWKVAERRGLAPLPAVLFMGLNPVLLAFAIGGAHNDPLMVLLVFSAVALVLSGRTALGGAGVLGAAAIKLSGGLILPFMAADRRRLVDAARGAAVALAVLAVAGVAAFGTHALGFLDALRLMQKDVALYSVPNTLGRLLGFGGITAGIRVVALAAFACTAALMLRRAWRGGDWLESAGWTIFAVLVVSAFLLPWYLLWLLPFAAVSRGNGLRYASLLLVAFIAATRFVVWMG
jgi:alpha-1,6-mannosyltransferase